MGYRSAVEAVFYTRNEEEWPILKLYIDENFPRNEELRECLTPIKANNAWGYHFMCDDVKWYVSYDFVREFNDFAHAFVGFAESKEGADAKQLSWAYEFVRLGEEANDIEEERSDNADYILHVTRDIELNF